MQFIDYYKILGITKKASEAEVKKAYRKLARKYHPDLNPNDKDAEKKFKEINEANEVLSNPENRKKYDQYGKDWQHADAFEEAKGQQRPRRSASGRQRQGSFSESDFSDFFENMFGGQDPGGRQVKFRGQDYNAELRLELMDAYSTHMKTLTVNGKNIRITIPAGVENGQTIKIKGHGGPGVGGGPKGDLYITFVIENKSSFKRVKNDLYKNVSIDLFTAVLGGEITVETLTGKVKLKVKPGTDSSAKVKLKGKGFPVYKKEGQFGDLYISYSVKIPKKLSDKQKALFEELSRLES
jgi:curved DNA-binding protein